MGIGASIFLLATGAILSWGVETNPDGVNLDTVGVILMVVGALGLFMSLLLFEDWQPWSRRHYADRRDYVDRREYVDDTALATTHRDVVIEDEPLARRSVVEEDPVVRRRVVTDRRGSW